MLVFLNSFLIEMIEIHLSIPSLNVLVSCIIKFSR